MPDCEPDCGARRIALSLPPHCAQEGEVLTTRMVPEPLPVVISQSHSPKHGLDQSLAAWAASGRRAATKIGVKTMASKTRRKTKKKERLREKERGASDAVKGGGRAKNEEESPGPVGSPRRSSKTYIPPCRRGGAADHAGYGGLGATCQRQTAAHDPNPYESQHGIFDLEASCSLSISTALRCLRSREDTRSCLYHAGPMGNRRDFWPFPSD